MRTWWTWRQTSTVIYFDPCSFRGLGTQVCQHCGRCIPQIGTFMPICPLCHSKGWGVPPRVSKYCFLFFLGFLDVFGFSGQKCKIFCENKKNNIPEVLGMGGSHQEFPNIVFLFFWFSQCFFDFSPWGPPQRDSKYFLMLSLHGGLY